MSTDERAERIESAEQFLEQIHRLVYGRLDERFLRALAERAESGSAALSIALLIRRRERKRLTGAFKDLATFEGHAGHYIHNVVNILCLTQEPQLHCVSPACGMSPITESPDLFAVFRILVDIGGECNLDTGVHLIMPGQVKLAHEALVKDGFVVALDAASQRALQQPVSL